MNKFTAITFSGLLALTSCNDNSEVPKNREQPLNKQTSSIINVTSKETTIILDETNKENLQNEPIVFENATVTSYNNEAGQTDNTPCINESSAKALEEKFGTGDICELYEKGIRTVAVPQSNLASVNKIVGRKVGKDTIEVDYGSTIEVTGTGNPICDGEFIVADAFNVRYNYKQKVDVFLPKELKHLNTKCEGGKVILKEEGVRSRV